MKYLDEFRDPALARALLDDIGRITTQPWAIGGSMWRSDPFHHPQRHRPTATPEIELIHGPGCPVCVTPLETIDKALAIAALPGVIFCSFGDMLRVPGSIKTCCKSKSEGGDAHRLLATDALQIARDNPDKQVVFFGIGFETTAPANAMAVFQAKQQGLSNFSMLVSHVLVPPAIEAIMQSPPTAYRAFWPPVTCAVSWAIGNTNRWQQRTMSPDCRHRL